MNDFQTTQGEQIRSLFDIPCREVKIIAPFIKTAAFESLLSVIPIDTKVICITRWRTREIAAGVSDIEIMGILQKRGNFELYLVDNLHAKLYIAGERCLVGSSNVTLTGLGEASDANIEILVDADITDPNVVLTLEEIEKKKIIATEEIAETIAKIVDSVKITNIPLVDNFIWIPHGRRPDLSYKLYTNPPTEYIIQAHRVLLNDLAIANLPPNLSEDEFAQYIQSLLKNFPLVDEILNEQSDNVVTFRESYIYFEEFADDDFSAHDLWLAFVNWMTYFFPNDVIEHHITEIALRRARLLA